MISSACRHLPLVTFLLVALTASTAHAVQPTLSAIDPPGLQRGQETEITFRGSRLEDAKELMFYLPGITVVSVEAVNASTVKAKLQVDADCRLGFHAVRLRCDTGISNLRMFSVGALPVVEEAEPNSEFDAPQSVSLDSTVHGVVQNEDVDYYVVEAKKGERITAELEGLRLGNTFFDPYLAILNAQRFELARSDDAALLRQDCFCSIIAPEDGKYVVQVRESSYGGDGNSKYRLHVGRFPRPTAVLPAGGRPGEKIVVRWIGDPKGDRTEEVTLPGGDADAEIFAKDETGIAPSGNGIRLSELPNAMETEPNNTRAEATAVAAPAALHGIIAEPGDVDHFKFTAAKGTRYDIRVFARETLRTSLDSVLVVRQSTGQAVGSNDDTGGPDSYLRFAAPADGDYVVEIRDHLRSGGKDYAYRIEVAPVKPRLTMSLPERRRYEATTLSVPRGNRMALMVAARRENFGGEINLNFEGLPAGMSFETLTMAANRNDVPVLFTAAADAPPAATLADLQGRTVDEKLNLVGHLDQRTMLVRGQNNADVYGHNAKRMAAAITQEVPFKIDIVPPKAPLVRNGSMELKIVATRAEGFTAPIRVRMLYNPPGVGSSGSISIAEGQTEAVIPLTANGNAAIGTWKIVVTGAASVGNGTVEVATQLADLEIADSYFNLAFQKGAVEQAQQTQYVVQIEKKKEFEGNAKIELLGLPSGTSTQPMEFNKDAAQVVFPIKAEENARPGRYTNLICRIVHNENGEAVTHTLGTGELRIDKPLPPQVAQKPKPAEQPKPEPQQQPQEPPKKVLSRLEQLRLAKEAAEN